MFSDFRKKLSTVFGTIKSVPGATSKVIGVCTTTLVSAGTVVALPYVAVQAASSDELSLSSTSDYVILGGSFIVSWALIRALPTLRDKLITPLVANTFTDLSTKIVAQFFNLSMDSRLSTPSGVILQNITHTYQSMDRLLPNVMSKIVPTTLEVTGITILLSTLYGPIGLTIPAAFVLQSVIMLSRAPKTKAADAKQVQESYAFHGALFPALGNYENVHLFGNSDYEINRLHTLFNAFSKAFANNQHIQKNSALIQHIITGSLIFGLGAYVVNNLQNGTLSVEDAVLFAAYSLLLIPSLENLSPALIEADMTLKNLEETIELINREPQIKELKDAPDLQVKPSTASIEFVDVSFQYDATPVLNNVSFSIKPGEKCAIVGLSGAGKSTLFKLLFRFYDVDAGNIYINGQDIQTITLSSLRSSISVVPQNCMLFGGTLRDNIMYGRLDAEAKELDAVIDIAELTQVIENQSHGLDKPVGEDGLRLSGGQKQRVSIARALLKKGSIFLFDESTSSLDIETETSVQNKLDQISEDHTTLIITHRLLTVKNAHKIIYLKEDGTIAEQGNFKELMANQGPFYQQMCLYCSNIGINVKDIDIPEPPQPVKVYEIDSEGISSDTELKSLDEDKKSAGSYHTFKNDGKSKYSDTFRIPMPTMTKSTLFTGKKTENTPLLSLIEREDESAEQQRRPFLERGCGIM